MAFSQILPWLILLSLLAFVAWWIFKPGVRSRKTDFRVITASTFLMLISGAFVFWQSGFRTINSSLPAPIEEGSEMRSCDEDPSECRKGPLPDWESPKDCGSLCNPWAPMEIRPLDPPLENFPSQLPLNAWVEFWECFMFRSAADRQERQDCEKCVSRECDFSFECCEKAWHPTIVNMNCLREQTQCLDLRRPACELAEDRETKIYCFERLRESLESCGCLEEIWQLPTLNSETLTP